MADETRQVGLRGLLPQREGAARFAIPWAHELLAVPLPAPVYPIDVTHGAPPGPMWGNDQKGDCGEAGERFLDLVGAYYAAASSATVAPPAVTDAEAIDEYLAYTGGQDSGVVLADFLLWLYQQGRIKAFAPAPHTDRVTCDSLMQLTGQPLYCGGSLFDNSEEQFRAGQIWDPAGLQPNQQLGHCINKCGSDGASVEKWRTWAAYQNATLPWGAGFLQGGEAWVVVTTDEQLALFTPALLQIIDQLGGTGGQPAPAPSPAPPPPAPSPAPPAPTPPGPPGPGCVPVSGFLGAGIGSPTVSWLEGAGLKTLGAFLVAFLAVVAGAGAGLFTAATWQAAVSGGILAGASVLESLIANVITPGTASIRHAYGVRLRARWTREAIARHHCRR